MEISILDKNKLDSLSIRLSHLTTSQDTNDNFNYESIKLFNLQYNIALLIAKIIYKMDYSSKSKNDFLQIIATYNKQNNLSLQYDDFKQKHWVREVANELRVPLAVESFIYKFATAPNSSMDISDDEKHLVDCLYNYYEDYYKNNKVSISEECLNNIIKNHHSEYPIDINFLTNSNILYLIDNPRGYSFNNTQYFRKLGNQIVAQLWLLVNANQINKTDEDSFKKYFYLIQKTKYLKIDNLTEFLDSGNAQRIRDFSIHYLNNEEDLLNPNDEIPKLFLEHNRYINNINQPTPDHTINFSTDCYTFIESVESQNNTIKTIFYPVDYHWANLRSIYNILIEFIVSNDAKCNPDKVPYQNTFKILKDTTRPYLTLQLYVQIYKAFPLVIPYMLTDISLIPLAFNLIDEIIINRSALVEQSDHNKKLGEEFENKNILWLEMFDFILTRYITSGAKFEEPIFGIILLKLANKVFKNINTSNLYNSLRARYTITLEKLRKNRVSSINALANNKTLYLILPSILNHLIKCIKESSISLLTTHNNFITLSSGILDLSIESLKLANECINDRETPEEQKTELNHLYSEMCKGLYNLIDKFYTVNTVGTIHATIMANESGFELMDWGYLYLCFLQNNLLEQLNNIFLQNLEFGENSSKYDEQNQRQAIKLKLFLKSLMVAFISIKQNINTYAIGVFQVQDLLNWLENKIEDYSLQYSCDAIDYHRQLLKRNHGIELPDDGIDVYKEGIKSYLEILKVYEGFNKDRFDLLGCTPYLMRDLILDDFKNLKNLGDGVYLIKDEQYFQIIAGETHKLILKNQLQDMSNLKDNQLLADEIYSKLFDNYISYTRLTSIWEILNSMNNPKKFNIFEEQIHFNNNIYYQTLTSLLFKCINNFKPDNQSEFLKKYFNKSIDMEAMLVAINLLESKEAKNILSEIIKHISTDNFINSGINVTKLKSALINATDSDNHEHWQLAKKFLELYQNHFSNIKLRSNQQNEELLFEVNLVLAFKNKDFNKLLNIEIPKNMVQFPINNKLEDRKRFIIALFELQIKQNYTKGINELSYLSSKEPENSSYAFQLFTAKIEKAIINDFNKSEIISAYNNWQLEQEILEKRDLEKLNMLIKANEIYYYIAINNLLSVKQILNNILTDECRYNFNLIPIIYRFFIDNNLEDEIYDYIFKASVYFEENKMVLPEKINQLLESSETPKLLNELNNSFIKIIGGLSKDNIPKVIPKSLNAQNSLDLFILEELIQALKILQNKKEAVRANIKENQLNDYLEAILTSRLPCFGMSLSCQTRTGNSLANKDAGAADIIINYAGQRIALGEALIVTNDPIDHLIRLDGYDPNLNNYYVIVYYKTKNNGEIGKCFDEKWQNYQDNIKNKLKNNDFKIVNDFQDMSEQFTAVRNFKIAKTTHSNRCTIFHIMVVITS